MFSKACEYGIRAIIYISKQSANNKRANVKATAKAINSPEAFTSKILQNLARNKVIKSIKGPNGGFFMDNDMMENMMLSTIIYAIDGTGIKHECALGLKNCNDLKPCPIHSQFKPIREKIVNLLESTTIKSMGDNLDIGSTFLKQ